MFHVLDMRNSFDSMSITSSLTRKPQGNIVVIGAGICGSTTAAVLAQAGWQVTLFDGQASHKGHLAAALTPVISSDDNARSRLSRLGATLAARYWRDLQRERGIEFGSPCGALQLQRPEGVKRVQDLQAQANGFNQPEWARWVGRDEASKLAGMQLPRGGIWYPGGWLVEVPKLVQVLQQTPGVKRVDAIVERIERARGKPTAWNVIGAQGEIVCQSNTVILANAFDVPQLLKRSGLQAELNACKRLPALHRLAGEITLLPANDLGGGPKCIVGGDGYVLPAVDGWCVSGGTYERGVEAARCTDGGRQANVDRARELLGLDLCAGKTIRHQPVVPVAREGIDASDSLPGWAGWRAVLPGRLPAIGSVPQASGIWVFTAGASRGLTWSVLGAMLIRDGLVARPEQVEPDDALRGLDPEMRAAIEP